MARERRARTEFFRTDFTNKIGDELVAAGAAPQGGDLFRYVNVDEVRNRGLELTAGHIITDRVEISGSYTFIDSEQLSGVFAGQPLNRTPKQQASLRLDWQTGLDGLSTWGEAIYTGTASFASQDRRGTVVTTDFDSYTTLDIGANYAFNENVTVRGGIFNVTDTEINSTDHGTTSNGRTFWLGLTTEF